VVGRVLSGPVRAAVGHRPGGMAEVWLAVDGRLGRPVAVKMLHDGGRADPSLPERFEREARTVARLSHPSIVAVHDVGVDTRTAYLVMELVQGTASPTRWPTARSIRSARCASPGRCATPWRPRTTPGWCTGT